MESHAESITSRLRELRTVLDLPPVADADAISKAKKLAKKREFVRSISNTQNAAIRDCRALTVVSFRLSLCLLEAERQSGGARFVSRLSRQGESKRIGFSTREGTVGCKGGHNQASCSEGGRGDPTSFHAVPSARASASSQIRSEGSCCEQPALTDCVLQACRCGRAGEASHEQDAATAVQVPSSSRTRIQGQVIRCLLCVCSCLDTCVCPSCFQS